MPPTVFMHIFIIVYYMKFNVRCCEFERKYIKSSQVMYLPFNQAFYGKYLFLSHKPLSSGLWIYNQHFNANNWECWILKCTVIYPKSSQKTARYYILGITDCIKVKEDLQLIIHKLCENHIDISVVCDFNHLSLFTYKKYDPDICSLKWCIIWKIYIKQFRLLTMNVLNHNMDSLPLTTLCQSENKTFCQGMALLSLVTIICLFWCLVKIKNAIILSSISWSVYLQDLYFL